MDETVSIECAEGYALLLIHNPRLRNALTESIARQLASALEQVEHDSRIGAVLMGSALEGVFSSGGNIRELRALAGSTAGLWFSESMQSVFGTVAELAKPVIAVVNGLCFGAGLALAMAADLRIAADTAVFSSPQVGLGIIPGLGGGQRAIRLCGRGPAKHSILTGGRINAESALRMGLVELVVPAPELWAVARSMATLLASKPQHPMALAKRAVNLAQQASLGAGCAYEASQFGLIGWPQSFEHLSPGTSWVEGECC